MTNLADSLSCTMKRIKKSSTKTFEWSRNLSRVSETLKAYEKNASFLTNFKCWLQLDESVLY